MNIRFILTIASLALTAFQVTAQSTQSVRERAAEIVEMTATDPYLSQAAVSICVRNGMGETLAEFNPTTMLVPASNVKLLTTGAALQHFGGDYRFETAIGYKGEIQDGILKGDLYIIGKGDPTLGSKDSIAVSLDQTFSRWEKFVREAGIRRIEGRIIGDGRWFDSMPEEETWLWNDIGTYYGTGVTGLMFYENMMSFMVEAGKETGAPVNISPYYPHTPWMKISYNCSTGEKGTGDRLYMYTSSLAPVAEITGTFGIDRGKKRVDCSNKYPEYTCATYFAEWLDEHGIRCSSGAADFRLTEAGSTCGDFLSEDIHIIGVTHSPELKRIIFTTNRASNNLYAETLLKSIGRDAAGESGYKESVSAMLQVISRMGVNTSQGIHLRDGSGLSRQDYVSSDFFCRFLEAMMKSDEFEAYAESLPSPGFDGSLSYNMKGYPLQLRERIKVKSGSMNGVRCYSGYIIPTSGAKDETIIFSILTSNCTSPNWKVRPLLDRFMASLAGLN